MTLLLLAACVSGADAPADTASAPDEPDDAVGVRLPAGCEPGEPAVDPLVERSALELTSDTPGEPFMEFVDVDLRDGVVYGVGQGGLVVATLDGAGQLALAHRDPGMGRFHRVERTDTGAVALTHRDQGLALRDAAAPQVGGATLPGGGMEGLAAVGDRLYVSDRSAAGVRVFQVAGPGSLVEQGFAAGAAATWELLAHEGVLYAADNDLGLVLYDLASRDAPVWIGPAGQPGAVLDLAVADGVLYAARGAAGVEVWALDDPRAPTRLGLVPVGGSAVAVAAADGWLWVADHEGISVLDLADPRAPAPFAHEATRQFALALDAAGDGAVVGDWGWLEAWAVDPAGAAPALDLDRHSLASVGGEARVQLHNRGGAPLELRGAAAQGAEVWADAESVAPGATVELRVRWAGEAPAQVCLATNDPDAPTVTLPVDAAPTPPVGEPAPDFSLPTLDGGTVRLSEQLGHPVVLAYFATW